MNGKIYKVYNLYRFGVRGMPPELKTEEKVPEKVMQGILKVRDSGAVNMFDYLAVADLCELNGDRQAAEWIRWNRHRYAHLALFGG